VGWLRSTHTDIIEALTLFRGRSQKWRPSSRHRQSRQTLRDEVLKPLDGRVCVSVAHVVILSPHSL
jgi:hypothetical protein